MVKTLQFGQYDENIKQDRNSNETYNKSYPQSYHPPFAKCIIQTDSSTQTHSSFTYKLTFSMARRSHTFDIAFRFINSKP